MNTLTKLNNGDFCIITKTDSDINAIYVGKSVKCKEYPGYFNAGELYFDILFTQSGHFWLVEGKFGNEGNEGVICESALIRVAAMQK